jgi:hypothetical protein
MVSAFVHNIAEKGNEKRKSSEHALSAQTLREYAKAAECWCTVMLQLNLQSTVGNKGSIHPFIQEILSQRRAWEKPRLKKEPITLEMFDNAQDHVGSLIQKDGAAFLSRAASVHNFTCLGAFTGSRVGEYGQTKARRGVYNKIPSSADAGEWAGMPIAFIRSDFTFWADRTELDKSDLGDTHQRATEVYIRFRYDKSINNFTIRKFKRTGHHYFCPVLASLAAILRANILQVPADKPVGVFRLQGIDKGYVYLTNTDVTQELRATCLRTYPDKNHYMNKKCQCIMAHSVRVTAAVALYTAGQTFDTIAFRLRWSVQSVQHYIRECCQHIGELSDAVLIGAGRI